MYESRERVLSKPGSVWIVNLWFILPNCCYTDNEEESPKVCACKGVCTRGRVSKSFSRLFFTKCHLQVKELACQSLKIITILNFIVMYCS